MKVTLELVVVCTALLAQGAPLQPLTDAQADAIILERERAQADQQAARRTELDQAPVKSEGHTLLANGQRVIIREVEPPTTSSLPAEAVSAPEVCPRHTPTAEQVAHFEAYAHKQHRVIMLSATVYEHAVTRLEWEDAGIHYLAYAGLDFKLLRGVHHVSTEATEFTYFMGIEEASDASKPDGDELVPDASAFSSHQSEYILVQGDPSNQAGVAGLEALLAHHDAHLPALKIAHQRREALAAAQQRYNAKHPKQPEDFMVQFWVPEPDNRKAAK